MEKQRTITLNDDKIEEAQKNRQGRQPGMKDDARRIGVPDDGELAPQSYLVKKQSFINGSMVEPGQIVRLPDGVKPGKFLEAVRVVHRKPREVEPQDDGEKETPVATPAATNTAPKPAAILGDIPDAPIPANAPRGAVTGGGAAKKLGLPAAKHEAGGDTQDDTNI